MTSFIREVECEYCGKKMSALFVLKHEEKCRRVKR